MRDTEIQENTNRKLFRESQGPGAGVGLGGEADRQTDRQKRTEEEVQRRWPGAWG